MSSGGTDSSRLPPPTPSSSRAAQPLRDPLTVSPQEEGGTQAAGAAGRSLSGLSLGAPRRQQRAGLGGIAPSSSAGGGLSADDAIRSTDSDALISRLSALRAGYLPSSSSPAPSTHHSSSKGVPDYRNFDYTAELASPDARSRTAWSIPPSTNDTKTKAEAVPTFSHAAARRPPVINIGTTLRCNSIDEHLVEFIRWHGNKEGRPKGVQVISLGAGSDDRFWRFKSDPALASSIARYVEIDFPQLTRAKLHAIQRSSKLQSVLLSPSSSPSSNEGRNSIIVEQEGTAFYARNVGYSLLPIDLRDLVGDPPDAAPDDAAPNAARSFLTGKFPGSPNPSLSPAQTDRSNKVVDASLPTFILFECVLSYLEPHIAQQLLHWLSTDLVRESPVVRLLSYDIALGGDVEQQQQQEGKGNADTASRQVVSEFGHVMLQNLRSRKLELPGAKSSTLPAMHAERLENALSPPSGPGFTAFFGSKVKSLKRVWEELPAQERDRLSRIEGLDEVEELELLLSHYCIAHAERMLFGPI